jgi:hypothetical protein
MVTAKPKGAAHGPVRGYDLGDFDDETYRLEPVESPFGPEVLPMS